MQSEELLKKISDMGLTMEELCKDETFQEYLTKNVISKKEGSEKEKEKDEARNFRCDYDVKYAFHTVEHHKVIKLLNRMLKTNFDPSLGVTFLGTEHIKTTGTSSKGKVIGDLAMRIDEVEPTVTNSNIVVEIQSSEDENIAGRVYVYGFNQSKTVTMEVKMLKAGQEITELKEVQVDPYKAIIYATLEVEEKEGLEIFYRSAPSFEVNGEQYSVERGDAIAEPIPFINVMRMSIDELNNSEFDFLQYLYLYKYKQNHSLIKSDKMLDAIKIVEENISELKGESYNVAMYSFVNIINDLHIIVQRNKEKYTEEVRAMNYLTDSYAGRLIERVTKEVTQNVTKEVTQKVRQEAYQEKVNTVLCMLQRNYNIEEIHFITKMPIDEIEALRTDNL